MLEFNENKKTAKGSENNQKGAVKELFDFMKLFSYSVLDVV